MADVLIVGDGPAGLSAALFLAKKGMEVTVFGVNKSDMHRAMLYNYLGIPEMKGSNFQKIARKQVTEFGASIQDLAVTGIEKVAEGFLVVTEDGGQYQAKYLILAEGKKLELAKSLDLPRTPEGVEADSVGRRGLVRDRPGRRHTPQPGDHLGRTGGQRRSGHSIHRGRETRERLRRGA